MSNENLYINEELGVQSIPVGETHRNKVKTGMESIAVAISTIQEEATKLSKSQEKIPENFGVRDELGDNVGQYIDEISESINDLLTPLNEFVNSKTAADEAYKRDKEDAVERYLENH